VRSVERVLTQLFTEAHRCFYWRSSDFECDKGIDEALAKSLRLSEDNPVFGRWQQGEFLELRRDVLWLTSRDWSFGATCRPEYVDPVDFLDWAVANRRFPRMLVGPAHGDLHGRNVIVGVVRGEAEWPAVFDFDRMSPTNLVAWDFAKLELELKCRLVEDLFIGEPDEAAVRRRLQLEDPRPTKEPVPMSPEELRTQRRADRLVVMLAFERKLHEWTTELSSKAQATTTGTSTEEESPENEPIGRALRIMFRIRREAAIYMGFERPGREQVWLDEYYFALAAYGVITAKWHSVDDHVAWALASAGVAAANLSLLPWPPKTDEAPSIPDCPTCFHLLPHAAARWNEGQSRRAIESLKSGLERFPYAVPLRRQLASSLIQSGSEAEEEEARRQIESLAGAAVVFRDYETLSQLGRIYKDAGDRFVDNATTCAESIARKSPSFQFYRSARLYYERAYELSGAYYPAVNAATLALLTGDREDAIRLANETLVICGDLRADRDDYVWILASQGEASLLLGRGDCAKMFYSAALQRLEPENVGVAKTMRDGLSRLRWGLGDDAVRLTLELFAQNVLLAGIGPSPFDAPRCERD
jgi:tetratricopeptide (TPR) repeat protein